MQISLGNNQKKLLHIIAWIIVFSIAVFLATFSINYFKISDFWISLAVEGIVILLIANIYRAAVLNKDISFNGGWVYWFIVYVLSFWFLSYIIPNSVTDNKIVLFALFGIGMTLISLLARRIIPTGHHHHAVHLPHIPWWLIILIIILIMVFIKIPYTTKQVSDPNLTCANSQVVFNSQFDMFGLMKSVSQMGLGVTCMEYSSSECAPICDNNRPACQCRANIWDVIMHPQYGYDRIGR